MEVDVLSSACCPLGEDGETSYLRRVLQFQRYRGASGIDRGSEAQICVPANFHKAFGLRGSLACNAFISCPVDEYAERILFETLTENAKAERFESEQSNLIRALLATSPANGDRWRELASRTTIPGGGLTRWGERPVAFEVHGIRYGVTVYALLEMLFLTPELPSRAVNDILSFFRSFFAVVAAYVSTAEGKLDAKRNEEFWGRSRALNELNLYIQHLKHASRFWVGAG